MRPRQKKSVKNKKKLSRRSGPKFWMSVGAMGALAACAAFSDDPSGLAHAQSPRRSFPAIYFRGQAQARTYRFDIPPGPLDAALGAFQRVTGWRVILKQDEIGSIPSGGAAGIYTIEQGIKHS
jgi:hypothetical protein